NIVFFVHVYFVHCIFMDFSLFSRNLNAPSVYTGGSLEKNRTDDEFSNSYRYLRCDFIFVKNYRANPKIIN
ncbi:hypothetical protein L9F63_015050, partial [Diploptera punctata]